MQQAIPRTCKPMLKSAVIHRQIKTSESWDSVRLIMIWASPKRVQSVPDWSFKVPWDRLRSITTFQLSNCSGICGFFKAIWSSFSVACRTKSCLQRKFLPRASFVLSFFLFLLYAIFVVHEVSVNQPWKDFKLRIKKKKFLDIGVSHSQCDKLSSIHEFFPSFFFFDLEKTSSKTW